MSSNSNEEEEMADAVPVPSDRNGDDDGDETTPVNNTRGSNITTPAAAAAAAAAAKTDNPTTSPPGMSLRSGRKKRRRSPGTSGLTPPQRQHSGRDVDADKDEKPAKKRRRVGQGTRDEETGTGQAKREKKRRRNDGEEEEVRASSGRETDEDEVDTNDEQEEDANASGGEMDIEKEQPKEAFRPEEEQVAATVHVKTTTTTTSNTITVSSSSSATPVPVRNNATAITAPAPPVPLPPPHRQAVPAVSNLRIPSLRTPGNVVTATTAEDLHGAAAGSSEDNTNNISGTYEGSRRLVFDTPGVARNQRQGQRGEEEEEEEGPAAGEGARAASASASTVSETGHHSETTSSYTPIDSYFRHGSGQGRHQDEYQQQHQRRRQQQRRRRQEDEGGGINDEDSEREGREDTETVPNGRRDALPRRLLRSASSMLVTFTGSIQELTTAVIVAPEAEHVVSPTRKCRGATDDDDDDGEEEDEMVEYEGEEQEHGGTGRNNGGGGGGRRRRQGGVTFPLVSRTSAWLVLFVLAQLVLSVVVPEKTEFMMLKNIPELSMKTLNAYRSFLGYDVSGTVAKESAANRSQSVLDELEKKEETTVVSGERDIITIEEGEEETDEEEEIEEIIEVETEPDPALIENERKLLEKKWKDKQKQEDALIIKAVQNMCSEEKSTDILSSIESEMQTLSKNLFEQEKKLNVWEESLLEAELVLNALVNAALKPSSSDGEPSLPHDIIQQANTAMEKLANNSLVLVTASLLDARDVYIPGEGCGKATEDYADADSDSQIKLGNIDNILDAPLDRKAVEAARDDLIEMADETAWTVIHDETISDSVRRWITDEIQMALSTRGDTNEVDVISTVSSEDEKGSTAEAAVLTKGLNADQVQAVIDHRLEIELADQNGKYDYASVRAGAKVIRSGPRKTSPSLVDELPLINWALAASKIRFYGHSAEAALTPTYPKDALGQCWSFESAERDRWNRRPTTRNLSSLGMFASLTISLASPVHVTSVVVEHPPREISSQVETAIREFRVIGYEDASAEGKPWRLGKFRYDIDGSRSLQEFEVATFEFGQRIPALQSVLLAIDSNWGAEYSCLYRFRVHGNPI